MRELKPGRRAAQPQEGLCFSVDPSRGLVVAEWREIWVVQEPVRGSSIGRTTRYWGHQGGGENDFLILSRSLLQENKGGPRRREGRLSPASARSEFVSVIRIPSIVSPFSVSR